MDPVNSLNSLTDAVDETGFSGLEKIALTSAWNMIKADKKTHATQILLRFFNAHTKYLKHFKMCEERSNSDTVHAHSKVVVQSYTSLIEDGLKDVGKLNAILSDIIASHKKIRLTKGDMNAMTTIINDYFKEVLAKYMTPALENALNKMRTILNDGYDIVGE